MVPTKGFSSVKSELLFLSLSCFEIHQGIFCCPGSLELLGSSDSPGSASQTAWATGLCNYAWLQSAFLSLKMYLFHQVLELLNYYK
jgi:hypothetical protein